jgi:hypothetical protein
MERSAPSVKLLQFVLHFFFAAIFTRSFFKICGRNYCLLSTLASYALPTGTRGSLGSFRSRHSYFNTQNISVYINTYIDVHRWKGNLEMKFTMITFW